MAEAKDLELTAAISRSGVEAAKRKKTEEEMKKSPPPKKRGRPRKNSMPPPPPKAAASAAPGAKSTDSTKQAKLDKLRQYHVYFPALAAGHPKPHIGMSEEEIDAELHHFQTDLGMAGALPMLQTADIALNGLAESFLCARGIPAMGLQEVARENQELVLPELRELCAKYCWWLAHGPELRYLMKFLARTQMVIDMNKKQARPQGGMSPEDIMRTVGAPGGPQ